MPLTIEQDLTPVNFTKGRSTPIRGICIHTMVGTFDGTYSYFKNPASNVSAHYIVALDSGKVIQMVKESDRAFTQGTVKNPTNKLVVQYGGNPNDYFIGIENADNGNPAQADRSHQYPTLIALVTDICQRNNIPVDRDHICGHHEIRSDKTCPGNLDVDYIVQEVKKRLTTPTPTPTPSLTDIQVILGHYNVKSADELISMVDEQFKFLNDARNKAQFLSEKYADYDKQVATAKQYHDEYDGLAMWLKEITGSPTDDIAVNKAEVRTRFDNEGRLQDRLNEAQKALNAEKVKHAGEIADLTKRANDLTIAAEKLQQQNQNLLTQMAKLKEDLVQAQRQNTTMNVFQQAITAFRKVLERKP